MYYHPTDRGLGQNNGNGRVAFRWREDGAAPPPEPTLWKPPALPVVGGEPLTRFVKPQVVECAICGSRRHSTEQHEAIAGRPPPEPSLPIPILPTGCAICGARHRTQDHPEPSLPIPILPDRPRRPERPLPIPIVPDRPPPEIFPEYPPAEFPEFPGLPIPALPERPAAAELPTLEPRPVSVLPDVPGAPLAPAAEGLPTMAGMDLSKLALIAGAAFLGAKALKLI